MSGGGSGGGGGAKSPSWKAPSISSLLDASEDESDDGEDLILDSGNTYGGEFIANATPMDTDVLARTKVVGEWP